MAEAGDARLAGLLIGLRSKGETVAELDGLVRAMDAHAVKIGVDEPFLDIVGTGGDQAGTVNISTMSAIVAAAAGARISPQRGDHAAVPRGRTRSGP
ncbi:hypothetical protein [Saccharopolyspora sp. ASAGF58]|uniref:hypothetical protein n=1 Tax=Saccharopolyspora sp. ASAGF58 TaxID=2719023 RepID=UPI001B30D2F7|nr:hypothetical protein [Saccharopolyspora sp. ASAGF58]